MNECLALGQLSLDKTYMNSNGTYVDSFATSSCSTGMHVNAYQTPNCDLQNAVSNAANLTSNISSNLLLKNSGIYGNNYTTCTNLLTSLRPGSNHNLVDDVYGNNYLPSPYAATRIQLPANITLDNETHTLKLDHQQLLLDKKTFSNIYDIPQQQCATNQQKQNNQINQIRNNSISIVS